MTSGAPSFLWDPHSPAWLENPYPYYARLRNTDPIHAAQTGEWIVTRYSDVSRLLKDRRFLLGNKREWVSRRADYFHERGHDFSALSVAICSFPLFLNGAQHNRVRRLIGLAWRNRDVEGLIRNNVARLLVPLSGAETFDIVARFTDLLPELAICGILGIPEARYPVIRESIHTIGRFTALYVSLKELVEIGDSIRAALAAITEIVQDRRQRPDDGLLSRLIVCNEEEGIHLPESDLVSLCIFLLSAATLTSRSTLSSGIYNLIKHPEQEGKLRREPALIDSAVEELLRYDSALQFAGREADENCEIGGVEFKKGSQVTLCLGAANRDPAAFPEPDRLDLARSPNRHVAFGLGSHRCFGDWLGRIQAQIAISELLRRTRSIDVAEQPLRNRDLGLRGFESLPVSVRWVEHG